MTPASPSLVAHTPSVEGTATARAKAKPRGKPPKPTTRQQRELVPMHDTGEYSIAELGEPFTVSRAPVYRVLERHRITNAAAGQQAAP